MKFKKQIFGFMDMLRFKKLVPNRREALANGSDQPLPADYRTNNLATALHPGYMEVELTHIVQLTPNMKNFTFKRVDSSAFPFFRAGQYVSLQAKIGDSLVSRPYSISSSPDEALEGRLSLGIEDAGFFSGYMNNEAKIGDRFVMTEPSGEFHYENIRDKKNIVCIAGGSGITPFLSMAKSVAEGNEDYNMTLFYGAKDFENLAYRDELEVLKKSGVQIIYVLETAHEGCEQGFVTAKMLEKYVDINASTFFMCGPVAMYASILDELKPYNLPLKSVRKDAATCGDLDIDTPKTFRLTVHMRDKVYEIDAKENETLLTSMERAGLNAPNKCRAGGCGFCHSKWLGGEYIIAKGRDGRREADRKFGFIHPCVTYPQSDMEIDVPVAY